MRGQQLLQCEPVAAEHRVDELEVRVLGEHAGIDLAAHGGRLHGNAAELAAQHRVFLEVLERVLARGVVHDRRHVQLVENLHHRVEQLVVQELVAVRAGELHAHHAELLDAALHFGDVLGTAVRGHDRVGEQAAAGLLAHLGSLVVHDLANLERQPFLPHRHAQHGHVDAGLVHGVELGLEGVVALDVVQDLIAVVARQNNLVLRSVGRLVQVGLHAHGDRRRIQEPIQDLRVREQVRR